MTSDGRVVIVGAGPAGLSCARGYRREGGELPVLILGDDPDPPYERPELSKGLLRGETGRSDLPLEDESFYTEERIELRTGCRVVSLDVERRVVTTEGGEEIAYEGCAIATGSRPVVPDVPGASSDAVATLRWVGDSERLRARSGSGARVLVVGSGFIGSEAAISMASNGAEVTMATKEAVPQGERLGSQIGDRIATWLREAGVELITEVELSRIDPGENGTVATLGDRTVEADLILLALGVERNSELAAAAGLELDGDAVRTDERMRTSATDVVAAGDVAMAFNPTAGRHLRVEHWGEALNHGEIAGATLAGAEDARWDDVPGFWSGLGDRTLKYVAWGDGFDDVRLTDHDDGGFTARYVADGELVGVLAHEADDDYERGRELVEGRASWT